MNRNNWMACAIAWGGLLLIFCLLGCEPALPSPEPEPKEPAKYTRTHPVILAGAGHGLVEHGRENYIISRLAQEHADSMARRQHQDHNGFESRARRIMANEVSEICAESWPGQSKEEAAAGCWMDWAQSPSHWRTANGKPILYGVAMSQGSNGIWYVCIIATWE
ncbi:MAG: spore germination YkwD domain-containing protein [Planctomycetota bacterium]|jgi:hypothetical protein